MSTTIENKTNKNDIIHFVYSAKDLDDLGLMDQISVRQLSEEEGRKFYDKYLLQLIKEDKEGSLPYNPLDANIVIYQESGYFYLFEV